MKMLVRMIVLLIGATLVFAACGSDEQPPSSTTDPVAEQAVTPTSQPSASEPTLAQPAPAAGDAARGKQFFVATCSACHGPDGEGVKGLGKDMTQSEFIASLPDQELAAFVRKGRPVDDPLNTTGVIMPPSGGNPALSDEQLRDIIAFIRSIHK